MVSWLPGRELRTLLTFGGIILVCGQNVLRHADWSTTHIPYGCLGFGGGTATVAGFGVLWTGLLQTMQGMLQSKPSTK